MRTAALATVATLFLPTYQIAENAITNTKEENKLTALKNIVDPQAEDPNKLYEQEKQKPEAKKADLEKHYRRTKRRKKIKHFALGTAFGLTGLAAVVVIGICFVLQDFGKALASSICR